MSKLKRLLRQATKLIMIFAAVLPLHGCATMLGDNMRTVIVDSHPQGAGVYVDGQRQGTTPTTITLPNYIYGGKSILVKKEGYHEQAKMVNAKFQPCGLWNILFLPGFLIDGVTGNIVKIDPASLHLLSELEAVKTEESKADIKNSSGEVVKSH